MKVKYKVSFRKVNRQIETLREQVRAGFVLCWDYYGDTFSVVYRGM